MSHVAAGGRDEWESHWSDFYEASQVNPAARYRLRIVLRWLDRSLGRESRFLDIGSGAGDLVAAVSERHPSARVRGVELSETGIEIARKRAPRGEFRQCNLVEAVKQPNSWSNWADVAVCAEVLEHVEAPQRLLSNAKQLLAPSSRLFVTVPGGPRSAFDRHIGHRRHYTRRDLRALLETSGFSVDRCDAVGFPVFNLYRLLVIAMGKRLVREAASGRTTTGYLARLAGATFDALFRLNPPLRRAGWQLTAEARLPAN